jgi:Tfp pilus assembly protein PilE
MPEDSTVDKIKVWAFPALLAVLNILLTTQIGGYTNDIKETRKDIIELSTTVKLETMERQYLTQRVHELETDKAERAKADKERDTRINSLEQRAAIYDQFMSIHK